MSKVKHELSSNKIDKTTQSILEKNLRDYDRKMANSLDMFYEPMDVRERITHTHKLLKKVGNRKIPRGITKIYTGRVVTTAKLNRAYKILVKDPRFQAKNDEVKEKAVKKLAAWEDAMEKAMYDIYKELIRMWNVGVAEFYGQYAPQEYGRTGGQIGAGKFTISGHGSNTTIHCDVGDPGYTYTTSWTGRYINAEAETWFMTHGMRLMGGSTALPAGGVVPTSWDFSYSSSIIGAYIAGTLYDSIESVIANGGELAYERALMYFGAISAQLGV